MIKLLIGGSPCTYWSIAQKNNRETEPSGMGWELFENYLIAKEKFKPDFFLYENNKSAAQAIKDEIKKRLEVWDGTLLMPDSGARYIEINSALVSAQNRQRFYVHNCGEVGQPKDRGILLKDILESGQGWTDKSYALTTREAGAIPEDTLKRRRHTMVAEPANTTSDGKARTIKAQYARNSMTNFFDANYGASAVAEPVCVAQRGRYTDTGNRSKKTAGNVEQYFEAREDSKTNALTTVQKDNGVAVPVRVGTYPSTAKNKDSRQYRIYSEQGKATTLCGEGGGNAIYYAEMADGTKQPIYEVKDGKITVKGKQYPIKLADGFYIIRKLTVTECCRLQTMPDIYMSARIEKVKEIILKCKDVPTQTVAIPLRTEKRGCAINTTFDLKEMEVRNLKDRRLIHHCLALSRDVIDIDKHIWDIVLCTIKDLQEKGQHDYFEAIMNMFKATMSADLSIEKLPKECLDENSKKEKSYTILTLIQKIIAKITSMFVPQKNTRVYIENCAENCLSTSPTSLTVGTLYSTEKNMRLVSESACYKGLGNGWAAEVIIHILNGALKDVPKDEEIVVLSMYDGIGTGRYCLDKMGFTNVKYYAYEIDKFAMQVAMSNYPDIVQCGDAFQVRQPDWKLNWLQPSGRRR